MGNVIFIANFVCFPAVQRFWKSVKIWQSYRQFKGGNFLRHSVDMRLGRGKCHIDIVHIPMQWSRRLIESKINTVRPNSGLQATNISLFSVIIIIVHSLLQSWQAQYCTLTFTVRGHLNQSDQMTTVVPSKFFCQFAALPALQKKIQYSLNVEVDVDEDRELTKQTVIKTSHWMLFRRRIKAQTRTKLDYNGMHSHQVYDTTTTRWWWWNW